MKPPSIYIVFQRATFRSGLENQHFRILADLAANPINTVLLGHAHFWKNVPKSWKSIRNEPILKFPGWDSGILNPRTIIRLIRPLPTPKSGLKNQKSSKIQNIRNPKVYTKFVRQPYVSFVNLVNSKCIKIYTGSPCVKPPFDITRNTDVQTDVKPPFDIAWCFDVLMSYTGY